MRPNYWIANLNYWEWIRLPILKYIIAKLLKIKFVVELRAYEINLNC